MRAPPETIYAPPDHCLYGLTRKGTLLESTRLAISTSTLPLVAPSGTVAVIKDRDTTVNVAAVPLNVTLVAPVRSVPRILTVFPALLLSASVGALCGAGVGVALPCCASVPDRIQEPGLAKAQGGQVFGS
jgi:hypothetical protein